MKKANKSQSTTDHNKHLNLRMNQENENLNGKVLPRGTKREPLHHVQKKTVAGKALQRPEAALDVNNNASSGENTVEDVLERKGKVVNGTSHEASSLSWQVESGRESTGSEGQKSVDFEEEIEEALPWHHLQLYNFMGKEADYFLYPKLDMDKRTTKPLMTPLKNKTGYNSVDALWAALRQDSSKRLCARVDDNIHPELKATYRAYIREYMKGRDTEDKEEQLEWGSTQVPEIEELLDDSCLRKITERRRKVQIMFRSSLRNEDRTKILLYNNPLPDINNDSGTHNIMRFLLPSSAESSYGNKSTDNEDDQSDELSQDPDGENADGSAVTTGTGDQEIGAEHDEFVWADFDGQGKRKPVKCVFLTEADASSVGRFSRKRKELMDAKATDTQCMQIQNSRQDSAARPMIDSQRTTVARSTMATEKKKTSPPATSYQPLTLGALMEYSAKCSAPGRGNFKFGTRPMWVAQEKTF